MKGGEDVVEPYVCLLKLTRERSCADVFVGIDCEDDGIALGTQLAKFMAQIFPEDLPGV